MDTKSLIKIKEIVRLVGMIVLSLGMMMVMPVLGGATGLVVVAW